MVRLLGMIWKGCQRSLGNRGKRLRSAWNSAKEKYKDLTMITKTSVKNLTACCVRGKIETARQQLTKSCTKLCVMNMLDL